MRPESDHEVFEENLGKLLAVAAKQRDLGFQETVWQAVHTEVGRERFASRRRLVLGGLSAAAAVVVCALAWLLLGPATEPVGRVRAVYGWVELAEGDSTRRISGEELLFARQPVRTLSGSRGEIRLEDGSRFVLEPRTIVQVADERKGLRVRLQRGTVDVEAAKQQRGRWLAVETAISRVRALGTAFDVRLIRRPDGTGRTKVSVTSGTVELESGGGKILLSANTEGVADEGKRPQRHLADLELNEILQLLDRTNELARQRNSRAGRPSIVRFKGGSTAAVWTLARLSDFGPQDGTTYSLQLKCPASKARVFTLEGQRVPTSSHGRELRIARSALDPALRTDTRLILELPEVGGVFQAESVGVVQFHRPAGPRGVVTLIQFHLPAAANIESISPTPIEVTTKLDRQVITVAAEIDGLELWE